MRAMVQRRWSACGSVVILGLLVSAPGLPDSGCPPGAAYERNRAAARFGGLAPTRLIGDGYGGLTTSRDDREAYFTVLSWQDDDLDGRVFGIHAASLHGFGHRRKVWADVATELATLPTAWRSEGGREPVLAAVDELRRSAGTGARDLLGLAALLEESARALQQMNLGYLDGAQFGAGLANKVKHLLSARAGGTAARDRVSGWLGHSSALLKTLEAVDLLATLADQVVAASVINALATDEAVRRAEAVVEVAASHQDPAFRAGATDALAGIRAVQESNWYEYVVALRDHLPELTAAATVEGSRALYSALAKTSWWRTVSAKGAGPQLVAITASVEAAVALIEQNFVLQRAALLAVAESAVWDNLDRRRRAVPRDDRAVVALADREAMLHQAAASYYETMLVATGPQGWLDIAGRLIRWLSPGQRELESQLGQERRAGEERLLAAVRARRDLLCPLPAPAAARSDSVDLIFCIDTTGSMEDDIDAAKATAASVIDTIFASVPDPRIALVAYRDYGDEYVTRGFPFTSDKETIRANVLALTVAGGGDEPEAVYEALLRAINTEGLGSWRDGVKKIVVAIGDAPPHTRRHSADEVVKRAAEVDPAHVFAIGVKGADAATLSAFDELARRRGGVVVQTAAAADLPAKMIEIARIGATYADRPVGIGEIVRLDGSVVELRVASDACREGQEVVFFDLAEPARVVARGPVTSVAGGQATIELQEMQEFRRFTERAIVGFAR